MIYISIKNEQNVRITIFFIIHTIREIFSGSKKFRSPKLTLLTFKYVKD